MSHAKPQAGAPEVPAAARTTHLIFWALLFVVFPLATMPKVLLEAVPQTLVTFPENGFAEVLIPKLSVFVGFWTLGAVLCFRLWRSGSFRPLSPSSPLRAPFLWLGLFLLGSSVVSLLNPAALGLSLPWIDNRYESIFFGLLENAWYALTFLAAGVFSSRRLRATVPLHLLAFGACAAGGWALLEAYGVDPMRLIDEDARVGLNVQATLGHQGYVAAFMAVALVFWTTWRLLQRRVRLLDVGIIALLSASLVASGGRAGLLAALFTLSALVYWLRQGRQARSLLLLGAVMLSAGTVTLLTSPHAQTRLERLGTAVQGQDPATSHRLIFWQVGFKAILERPLSGYGIDAFGNAAWYFASPAQASEMITEFLPPETARSSVRLGKLVLYRNPGSSTLVLAALEPYRVHNYLLDIAFASGVPVALLFLGFIAASLRALYRARTPLSLATALALLTYLLYGMAWFATPNVDPLVWGLLGLGLGSLAGDKPSPTQA